MGRARVTGGSHYIGLAVAWPAHRGLRHGRRTAPRCIRLTIHHTHQTSHTSYDGDYRPIRCLRVSVQ